MGKFNQSHQGRSIIQPIRQNPIHCSSYFWLLLVPWFNDECWRRMGCSVPPVMVATAATIDRHTRQQQD
jgi:hypothetical protein